MITFRKLAVTDKINGNMYNATIANQWFEFEQGRLKFALHRHDARCWDFEVYAYGTPLPQMAIADNMFDCSEFYLSPDSRHKENSMSEKVSKPGDLDKFVPTKATVPNFTIQSQDTTVANVVEQASQVVEQAFSSFNKFLDENAKVVSEMPKWKQEAYKVVPDTPETTDKFIPSYSMNEMIYPQDADIKHPKHYTSHPSGVECITIVQHHNFNTGNAIKYLWRAGLKVPAGKNETEAAIKDLQKAKEYIEFEIRRLTT